MCFDIFTLSTISQVIIEQLVKNSTTFDSKTEFSKQKYIKRKTKK